jgi:hypothetical protein
MRHLAIFLGIGFLFSSAAFGEETAFNQLNVAKRFRYSVSFFSITGQAMTRISVTQVERSALSASFLLEVAVTAHTMDVRQMGIKWEGIDAYTVSMNPRLADTGQTLSNASYPENARCTNKQFEHIRAATLRALDTPLNPGTGINMNTFAARTVEVLSPGIQAAFLNGMNEYAFTDRREEIATRVAEFVTLLLERKAAQ